VVRIDFLALEVVVGVVKRPSVGLQRQGAKDRVVHHPLHAVAISRIACHPQQISRQFEMRVRSARRLKAAMRFSQAVEDIGTICFAQLLIRTPTARRVALR
jgi:hypothetical protein